ncbi:MAG: VWA domain-containing protein [Moraxellaceae bacterium]|nr:VWA domain-containing protein [Moraxellaceae bacterium]
MLALLAACNSQPPEAPTTGAAVSPPAPPVQEQARARAESDAAASRDQYHGISALMSEEVMAAAPAAAHKSMLHKREVGRVMTSMPASAPAALRPGDHALQPVTDREKYQTLDSNPVKLAAIDPVSTFSLDVDTGSYSNVRRFLSQGRLPPRDAVRVEELLNYFAFDYPAPDNRHPFAVSTELAASPWHPDRLLLRVGVKAVEVKAAAMPPANLVFLVDVSGSMFSPDKLPLVKATLLQLVNELRAQDRVSLVVYAGRTAVELPPTSGTEKEKIRAAIARLEAGGATAGEAAISLAYQQARASFINGGINRILLATDGDFNVGVNDIRQLKDMVARERESGVTLTTLGFGQGNYQEALMEQIANIGNGNYSYIDSLEEGRKVLVDELSSTFNTVAQDVKLQMEFNSAVVKEWRLVGYENRVLREEDFRNDKVDAGDVGAGKSVTALYELTPVGKPGLHAERRYAQAPADVSRGNEIGFLRMRYKQPGASKAQEFDRIISLRDLKAVPSDDFRFAAAVAGFGQLLRGGDYLQDFGYADVKKMAESARGRDAGGYRQAFVRLVDIAAGLTPKTPAVGEQASR